MIGPLDVAAALANAARDLEDPQDLGSTLEAIITVARDSMPEVDHVGISVGYRDGRVETTAMTDEVVGALDRLQYDLGEGPGLHAMECGATVTVRHARHEQRWPRFIAAAVRLGLRSQIGVRINVGSHTLGVLNMYSFTADEIGPESEQLAELFAAHAALALGHAQRLENLNAALASRKVIGLALGILMERFGIDEDRAFAYLTRISASTETKVRDVAASVVADTYARRVGSADSEQETSADQTV
jgi:GAF domain-containing protein